jgi:phospholipid-translocating ATPase
MPLDKDIVREMWVLGDLKDRLGITHRKASKNKHNADLETAPMFRELHARSTSELTLGHAYEPTALPAEPEESRARSANKFVARNDTSDALVQLGSSDPPSQQVAERSGPSPPSTPSPHPSYYSMSDIPIPSPVPPSLYRYPNGEITDKPPSRPASRTSRSVTPSSAPPLPELSFSPASSSVAHPNTAFSESFELQVRHQSSHSRSWSQGHGQYLPPDTITVPDHSRHQSSDSSPYVPSAALNSPYMAVGDGGYQSEGEVSQPWSGGHAL